MSTKDLQFNCFPSLVPYGKKAKFLCRKSCVCAHVHLIFCELYHFQHRYAREPNAAVTCRLCLAEFRALLQAASSHCTARAAGWDPRSPSGIPSAGKIDTETRVAFSLVTPSCLSALRRWLVFSLLKENQSPGWDLNLRRRLGQQVGRGGETGGACSPFLITAFRSLKVILSCIYAALLSVCFLPGMELPAFVHHIPDRAQCGCDFLELPRPCRERFAAPWF